MKNKTSRKTEGFLGLDPRTEHFDKHGNKTGESREVDGFFGLDPRTDHFDRSGRKTGETRVIDGFLFFEGKRSVHTKTTGSDGFSKSKSRIASGGYSISNLTRMSILRVIFIGLPALLFAIAIGCLCAQKVFIGTGYTSSAAVDVLTVVYDIQRGLAEFIPIPATEIIRIKSIDPIQMLINMFFIFGMTILAVSFLALFFLCTPFVVIYGAFTTQWELFFTGLLIPVAVGVGMPCLLLGIGIIWLVMLFLSSSLYALLLGLVLGPIAFFAALYILIAIHSLVFVKNEL